MTKSCINCKWYYNKVCNCKKVNFSCDNTISDQVNEFIEDGVLWEGIKESLDFKELARIYLKALADAGAVKKNVNNKLISSNIEDAETDIIEMIDVCISGLLKDNLEDDKINKVYVSDPEEFYCSNWE